MYNTDTNKIKSKVLFRVLAKKQSCLKLGFVVEFIYNPE